VHINKHHVRLRHGMKKLYIVFLKMNQNFVKSYATQGTLKM